MGTATMDPTEEIAEYLGYSPEDIESRSIEEIRDLFCDGDGEAEDLIDELIIRRAKKAEKMESPNLQVTLLFNKLTGEIVYAEVDTVFASYWCDVLRQPLGRLLSEGRTKSMNNSVATMYDSINKLPTTLFDEKKEAIVSPPDYTALLIKQSQTPQLTAGSNFRCNSCRQRYTTVCASCNQPQRCKHCSYCNRCGQHGRAEKVEEKVATPKAQCMKENLKFILTDNFEFLENSTITAVGILGKTKMNSLGDLSSHIVSVDKTILVSMLDEVFANSGRVLNNVFKRFIQQAIHCK